MDWLIKLVGNYFFLVSVAITAIFWIWSTTKVKIALGWRLVVGGVLAVALATIAGHLYYDPRPFVTHHLVPLIAHAADNGFPSDHALLTAFLGFSVLLYSVRVGLVLLVNAVLVGWARVAAHIHNPRDIVGSFVIAAVSVAVVELAARLLKRHRHAG